MLIEFERSGGHLPVTFKARVNSDLLSAQEATELSKLVADADMPERELSKPRDAPDSFDYMISIIDGKGRRLEVRLAEAQVSPRMRPLIAWLSKRATRGTST